MCKDGIHVRRMRGNAGYYGRRAGFRKCISLSFLSLRLTVHLQIQADVEIELGKAGKRVQAAKEKASRYATVTKLATTIALVSAAAAALTSAFFSFGATAAVMVPLAFSVSAPIAAFVASDKLHCMSPSGN